MITLSPVVVLVLLVLVGSQPSILPATLAAMMAGA